MKVRFTDVLRIEYLAQTPSKRRVYYQPLNLELGLVHMTGEGEWHAYSEGSRLPCCYTTEREAALACLTVWVTRASEGRKPLQFSEN